MLDSRDVVASKYRIVRHLGRGGMGVVFEAVNLATHARVAIKMLAPETTEDPEIVERVARELAA
jgi:serine/threonine-protein kinase